MNVLVDFEVLKLRHGLHSDDSMTGHSSNYFRLLLLSQASIESSLR